jgi:hypothetical protein
MCGYGLGRYLLGLVVTAIVAVVGWFTVGRDVLNKVNESNARAGGGGPQSERIVNARRFAPVVANLRRAVGADARLVSVTMRPLSVEFVTSVDGAVARGLRWRRGRRKLQRFEENAPTTGGAPWPLETLDPKAPQRIAGTISAAEDGDFHLSIGNLERAESGKLVWVMRGTIGERGVAWSADPDGRDAKRYDPSSPELSKGAALGQCIRRAAGDPVKLQRCVARYGR